MTVVSGFTSPFVTANEVNMNSALVWMYITALARRTNLRRIGVPIEETSSILESEWDTFSFTRRYRTRDSVYTGTMLFKTFKITTVRGCSVVEGEIHEQTFAEKINEHRRR